MTAAPDPAWPQSSRARPTIWRDYVEAALAVGGAALFAAAVPAIAGRRWGPTGFAEYALIFEALSILQPPLSLGLGIALPRYIPRLTLSPQVDRDAPGARDYLSAALAVQAVILGLVTITLTLGAGLWSQLLFGSPTQTGLIYAFAVLLAGSCLSSVAIGYLRGCFAMSKANALQLAYIGLIPLASILIVRSVQTVLLLTGLLSLLVSFAFLPRLPTTVRHVWILGRELFAFGVRRVPGEFCLFGLFGLPPILAAHRHSLVYAGYVSFAMSVVTAAGAIFAPISSVLLPHASKMIAEGSDLALRRHLAQVCVGASILSVVLTVALEIAIPTGVRIYLGSGFLGAVDVVRIAALAIPAYAIFIAVRSSLDAYHSRAVSLRSAVVGFAMGSVLTSLLALRGISDAEPWGFVGGLWTLAALSALFTVVAVRRRDVE